MSKRVIASLIVLMSISLLGIIGVQILWIRNAIQIQEKKFDSNINKVLHKVVNYLEKEEMVFIIGDKLHSSPRIQYGGVKIQELKQFIDKKNPKSEHEIHIQAHQGITGKRTHVISSDSDFFVTSGSPKNKAIQFWYPNTQIDSSTNIDIRVSASDTLIRTIKKEKQIENIFNKMVYEYKFKDATIKDRIDEKELPAKIKDGLKDFDIGSEFNYAVIDGKTDKVIISSDSTINNELVESKYRVNLFPNDIFQSNKQLVLTFPNRFNLVYKSIFSLLILSAIFTLFIIITFVNAVFFILKQKRISDIKSDFINNITHEFKTPIATIGLASDSINNPKIIGNPDRIRYFTSIIKDENFRMNKQVENILQLSLFGKHELEFNPQACHINEIIQKAVEHIQLQIDEKQGIITTKFSALNDIAKIDEVHFLNVLFNLLDNSIKYSESNPQIEIGTKNEDQYIYIWIKDAGIGMNSKTLKKIFKKFYRAETGNIHSVKGFGLGLSYVKLVIDRHQGKIDVKSSPGKGTTIGISLPLNNL